MSWIMERGRGPRGMWKTENLIHKTWYSGTGTGAAATALLLFRACFRASLESLFYLGFGAWCRAPKEKRAQWSAWHLVGALVVLLCRSVWRQWRWRNAERPSGARTRTATCVDSERGPGVLIAIRFCAADNRHACEALTITTMTPEGRRGRRPLLPLVSNINQCMNLGRAHRTLGHPLHSNAL